MNTMQDTVLLLTPKQAARALSVCERTLYALGKSGEIPVVRIGRAVRYDVADLKAWIERQKNILKFLKNSLTVGK